jgi:hypothetical protein
MSFYRAALPLSHQTLTFTSGLIRTHRRQIGSVWRTLNPAQQALLVLVYLRKGEPFAEVGAGFGVHRRGWRGGSVDRFGLHPPGAGGDNHLRAVPAHQPGVLAGQVGRVGGAAPASAK